MTSAPATLALPGLFTDLFIGGRWQPADGGAVVAVHDPATGDVVARVADGTVGDCLAAVDAAAAAAADWAATPPRRRAEVLRRAWEILHAERESIAGLIVAENGKSRADALAEADYAAEFFRWYSEEAVRVGGDFRLSPGGDKRIVVSHEPVGVCVLVTPWNFPAAMATRKIAPALAAGCTVVLRPATETPLTAAAVVDALDRAGVPGGVVNYVNSSDAAPTVRAMLHHPATRKLSFTGSTEVGRILLHEAADRVLSTSMELGGNAAFVVLASADIAAAVEGAMAAKMRNGGSACTAANRFYVHSSVAPAFTAALAARMRDVSFGPGADPAHGLGALVSTGERDKVALLVRDAVRDGAHVETGGFVPDGPGAFYPPTVLSNVPHGSSITETEIFGPVAPVITFDDPGDAVAWANDTERGLVNYVYGALEDAVPVAHRLQAGMVGINRGVVSDPAAPFGGTKQSGLGREGGHEGIYDYLEAKYLAVEL